ncbi:MAG TPA: acryloyl-CoA reductase, partial [Tetragenococcus sp.]|nr:acryloyl-CoA reductase [Tetragenococcus sp.]
LWKVGERVLVTGFGLGVAKDGGFSQIQDVPASWPVALPEDLSAKEAMAFGTAGFTAALCVQALIKQKIASEASILVTGASGGVASIAIALLKELGFTNITALSAKNEQETYLSALGAQKILKPEELLPEKNRPLAKEKFAAVIDTVGGDMLAAILPFMQYDGCVALCGNAAGNQLNTTVLPFILRNIRLIGIDSVNVKQEKRRAIWEFLAKHKKILNKIQVQEVILTDLDDTIEAILDARHVGRTIVEMEVKK